MRVPACFGAILRTKVMVGFIRDSRRVNDTVRIMISLVAFPVQLHCVGRGPFSVGKFEACFANGSITVAAAQTLRAGDLAYEIDRPIAGQRVHTRTQRNRVGERRTEKTSIDIFDCTVTSPIHALTVLGILESIYLNGLVEVRLLSENQAVKVEEFT